MSTEANKAVARRYWEETEQGKGVVGEDLFAPTYRHYLPGSSGPLDSKGSEHFSSMFYSAFPPGQVTIEDMIAEGDKVVSRITLRGTHQGTFQGIPPTGKQVTITGIQILRIADGKIVEHRSELDALGLLQQLGVIPPMG